MYTKKLIVISLLLMILTPCLRAQKKEIAQARSYIKSGKNFDKAEKLMTDLLEKESLIYTLNIIDHGTPNATQGIVAISQVLAVMRTLLAGSTAQQ